MVRQCQADRFISQHIDTLVQQRTALEVGLIVGRLGPARDYLLFLLKTPAQDGTEAITTPAAAAAAGSGKAAVAAADVRLDTEWIVEHAAQVTRMLPGGVAVVGAYLAVAGDRAFSAAAPQLCGLAKGLRAEAGDDSLLLHVDAATGKTALKEFAGGAAAGASGLKPAELRFAAVAAGFHTLRCSLDVDLAAPVPKGGASLCSRFDALVKREAARLEAGVALFENRPVDGVSPLAELLSGAGVAGPDAGADSGEPARFELLCPPACAAGGATAAARTAVGRVQLAGRLEGFAFVPRRAPAAEAVAALRADLVASLRARLDSVEEDAEALQAEAGLGTHPLLARPSAVAVVAPALPARIFLPTQSGVPVCEYQLEADTLDDVLSRARELLGSALVAPGAVPAGAEAGTRLAPPAGPWKPLQEQDTRDAAPPAKPHLLERLPFLVTLALWMLLGLAASLAALPVSKLILQNEWLSSKP